MEGMGILSQNEDTVVQTSASSFSLPWLSKRMKNINKLRCQQEPCSAVEVPPLSTESLTLPR